MEATPPEGTGSRRSPHSRARPPAGDALTGGRIALLDLPIGTGVRVDASLRTGDVVAAELDPVLATITAWGCDRVTPLPGSGVPSTGRRSSRDGGPTNRSLLINALGSPDLQAGLVPARWLAERVADGSSGGAPDPLALLVGAIEFYEADLAMAQDRFRASAARGRPEHIEAVGGTVMLSYLGGAHRYRVDKVAADRYRVHDGVGVTSTSTG